MKNIFWSIMFFSLSLLANAAELPYDVNADAVSELQQALNKAMTNHKNVLIIFGANWCPDCRELDKALHGRSRALINDRFNVVKIDVGNFDKNLNITHRYDDPIKNGIPAIMVLSPDNKVLYSTKGGELANARKMGDTGIYEFLMKHLAH